MRKKNANRCSDVLELIHTDICGPFPTPSWNGQQYFITFIDDYSRYGYLYLIHEKSQSLDVFKNFKAEVENQLSKKIKAVRSDRGGEYYGRYDGSGEQRPGPFAKYLMECGIVPQYTMPGTPSQNGVAERRNRTLKDMSTKQSSSQKPHMSYGLARNLVLGTCMSGGCPAEARPYKPNEKKLDSRTVSCYFVGYSERSRGFKFYDPSTRSFFETGNAKFIEDVELSGREPLRKVVFEEEFVNIPIITTGHGHIMFNDTIQNVQSITGIQDTPEIPPTQVIEPDSSSSREHEFDMGLEDDPISVSQVKQSSNSEKWIEAMKDEMKSMKDNGVWDLVELPKGVKPIGCKWIFKTKRDSKGNIVRYKARLVAKAHYDLELHQMDVKTAFLNGNIDETIYMVQPENFESKDSKQLIHRDRSRGILGLSQKAYIDKVLSRFGMSNCAPGDTPVAKGDKFSLHQCPKNELEKKDMERFPYARQYLSNPGMDHWKKAKRVMRYLQRTKDYMLTYRRSSHLEIVGYSDSDFAGCLDSRRSTSGYIFMLAGGAVSWKSVKQTLVASSTMEAEFIACYEASNHGIWLRNFVTQLRIVDGIEKPLRINCDNKAAELYSKNNRSWEANADRQRRGITVPPAVAQGMNR
ncbi:Retrovirus-related Pol polyprotein from transposon TNT 1-94 [Vitis vinifera]|uniref:Retrovirus-related Pol polyprotein from transposon TNT 1-94 n=1 Tax=Vitis vinifera TaxID=29760 RepID=A0A438EQ07_VITVI|nr:Retrovirus-related Pol polyprotein from transposon TNT 1-94 [Vitis vinifera]